jgi:hypothetical protein
VSDDEARLPKEAVKQKSARLSKGMQKVSEDPQGSAIMGGAQNYRPRKVKISDEENDKSKFRLCHTGRDIVFIEAKTAE